MKNGIVREREMDGKKNSNESNEREKMVKK
jgi:hypothetical protein